MTDKTSSRPAFKSLEFEQLEARQLLAATVYVDPGFGFTDQDGFQISDSASSSLNGPQVFGAGYTLSTLGQDLFDYHADDPVWDNAALQSYIDQLFAQLHDIFAPFDIEVRYAQASSVADIQAALQATATSDAYIYVGGMKPHASAADFGEALIDTGNTQDNLGFVFPVDNDRVASVEFIASGIARQAGKSFGLQTTEFSDLASSTDIMAVPGFNIDGDPTFSFDSISGNVWFQRLDMPQSLVSGVSPGLQNSFETLANEIGNNDSGITYFTTSGATNQIIIEVAGPDLIHYSLNGQTWNNVDISNGMIINAADNQQGDHVTVFGSDITLMVQTPEADHDKLQHIINGKITIPDLHSPMFQLGGGNDLVEISGSMVEVNTGAGDDTVRLETAAVINSGDGDDRIVMANDAAYGSQLMPGPGMDEIGGKVFVWDVTLEDGFVFGINDEAGSVVGFFDDFEAVTDSAELLWGYSTCIRTQLGCDPPLKPVPVRADILKTVIDNDVVSITDETTGHVLTVNQASSAIGNEIYVLSLNHDIELFGGVIQISSAMDLTQGTTDTINADIEIGSGRVVVSNMAGNGRNAMWSAEPSGVAEIRHLTNQGVIRTSESAFLTTFEIHGSDKNKDRFFLADTAEITFRQYRASFTIYGHGGDDEFIVGDLSLPDAFGYGTKAVMYGGEGADFVGVDDSAFGETQAFRYNIEDTELTSYPIPSTNLTGRLNLEYDSIETVYVRGSSVQNTFSVRPSTTTFYQVEGNGAGDSVQLDFHIDPDFRSHFILNDQFAGGWSFSGPQPYRIVGYRNVMRVAEIGRLALGGQAGHAPLVSVIDTETGDALFNFLAYESGFRGGVQVDTGFWNDDSIPDIFVAPGKSRLPEIRIFDGRDGSLLDSFFAFPGDRPVFSDNYLGGVDIAVANVGGDDRTEVVVSTMAGNADVRIWTRDDQQAMTLVTSYNPFPGSASGTRVATGDFNMDGLEDVVATQGLGGSSVVAIHSQGSDAAWDLNQLHRFRGYVNGYLGGFSAAADDLTGDGVADLVLAAINTGSAADPFSGQVRIFDGSSLPVNSPDMVVTPSLTGQPFQREFNRGISVTIVTRRNLNGNPNHPAIYAARMDSGNGGRIMVLSPQGYYADHFFQPNSAFDSGLEIG